MEGESKKKQKTREFDWSRWAERRIALLVAYLGWDMDGLVTQETTKNTVEEKLLAAMEKTKLVRDRGACDMKRCGRTDKGVSALRQVISIKVRSALNKEGSEELNYSQILNRVLPDEIRILAWAPVQENFDARHSCVGRAYKYFFPRGRLDLEQMQLAAASFVGTHDFRNFCRLARDKPQPTVRCIHSAVFIKLDSHNEREFEMWVLEIKASSFLWNQIRCIVAVLLAVGEGNELPSVVEALLDVQRCPSRPQYPTAVPFPLCFFDASFEGADLNWIFSADVLSDCMRVFQKKWAEFQIKATMVKEMMSTIGTWIDQPPESLSDILYPGPKPKKYVPMLKRPTGASPEEVQNKIARKQATDDDKAIAD